MKDLFITPHDVPPESQEETLNLLRALAAKYGTGAILAGSFLANLLTVIRSAYSPEVTKLEGEARERDLDVALKVVDNAVTLFANNIGACCMTHVRTCAESIMQQTDHLSAQKRGEGLEATAEAAARVIASASNHS